MNDEGKIKKSQIGVELVRLLAAEGDQVFSIKRARELSSQIGLKPPYLAESLYHLRRNGWIISIRRGLYALSGEVPGITKSHEYEVAMALTDPAAISHWSAIHYHGMTEQPPRRVFVLTTTQHPVPRRRKAGPNQPGGDWRFNGTPYQFVQVRPERFFGTEKVWVGDARISITDPERTLLDGLMRPDCCGDFGEVLHAFEVRRDELNLQRIIDYALRLDGATAKRLGWVLEKQDIEPDKLQQLAALPIKGYRILDPTGPRVGRCDRRWMIQENLPGLIKK